MDAGQGARRRTGMAPGAARALGHDLLSGLLVAVVTVAYSLSYATLVFSGPLAHGLAAGAGAVLASAGVCALVGALAGSLRFAVAAPDTAAIAVVSVLALSLAADPLLAGRDPLPVVLAAIALSTVLTGVVLLTAGSLRLGRWIRFIPYPVVGGFLAASGWLLASGTVRVTTGTGLEMGAVEGFLGRAAAGQLALAAAVAAALLMMTRRWRHPALLPATLLGTALALHGALLATGMSLEAARDAGWLLAVDARAALPLPWLDPAGFPEPALLLRHAGELAAIVAVTAVAILLNATGLEVETRTSAHLNTELRAGGAANLLAGALGGTVGNLTLNRSLLNLRAGAMGRVSAAVAGAATFGTLAAGSGLLGYVPRPLLGGLLLYMALALLGRWLVESRRRLSPADYALVVVIFFTIIQWGYLAGVVLGTVAACISFAVRYSRVRVIRREVTGAEFGSHVQWSPDQERALRAHGARIRVLWLQGFLFFGTANTLLEALRRRLDSPQPAGWLLLDFAGVQGLDSSAVFSFVKLRHLAEARGLTLVLSRLRPPLEAALRAEGAIDESSPCCRVAGDLDRALEWCEARLLEHVAPQADAEDRFAPWLAGEMGDPGHFARLLERLDPVLVPAGGTLFYQGAAPDAVYFIRLGRVSVLLTTPHAPAALRLRSMVGCTVVGEMGFYREVIRTASVVADEPTLAYRLSARTLERIHREDPELAASFHRLMVRLVADRLAFANQEVAALSR